MGYYHQAQICLNGHMINDCADYNIEFNKPYCPKCGAKTITTCPSCNAKIQGEYDYDDFMAVSLEAPVPSYCFHCGSPFPWTQSAIESAALIIQEEEELSEQFKASLTESLPDLVSQTPKTNLAIARVKKCFASAGKFTAEAIRQFIIDFGCELAKQSLGL